MKHIIKISETIGTEIRTRFSLNSLKMNMKSEDEYLFDMENVEIISRSAADELYNLSQQYSIVLIHMSLFVQQMMDAVAIGRFTKRVHDITDARFIKCDTMESLAVELEGLGTGT